MIAALAAFVLRHESLVGWAGVLGGACLFGALAAHRLDAPRLARAKAQVEAAREEAAAGAASARMTTAAAAVVEIARGREATLTPIAQEAADALAHAPSAAAPLPEDVRDAWARGVDRLRDEAAAAHAPPPDPGGPGAPRPVSAP